MAEKRQQLDPDGNKIVADDYNSEKTEQAKRAGVVKNADDLPLGDVGKEGNDLGSAARPTPFDEGDLDPAYPNDGGSVAEYRAPGSNLPTNVNPLDAYRKLQGSGGGY